MGNVKPKKLSDGLSIVDGVVKVDAVWFQGQQSALKQRGKPDDPCGRCGCKRKAHLPDRTYSGGTLSRPRSIPVLAPTSCDCKFCFCYCTAFVEPFAGQVHLNCVYEQRAIAEKAR